MSGAASDGFEVGINVPQESGVVPDQLRRYAADAEAVGYDSLWTSESTASDVLDPLSVMNFLAASTSRPTLGVAVLLAALRTPIQLARDLASLDQLCAGRSVVGVGLGNDRQQYALRGLNPEHRGRHFEDTLEVVRSLLRNERTTSNLPWWQLENLRRPLAPARRPCPPLWIGARQPAALDRAVRVGDGWVAAGSARRADFDAALTYVREALDRDGRSGQPFVIAKRVYLHVMRKRSSLEPLRAWFAHHYGRSELADEVVVAGDAEECAAEISRLRAQGVSVLIVHPVVDMYPQMRRIADDVIPLVGTSAQ